MIELHQYPGIWGLPSLSPFCIKVELFLRKNKIPYTIKFEKNPARGPKGKMPFIRDETRVISDSTFILNYLNRELKNPEAQALSLAFQRLIEENLYFVLLYSRWIDPVGWKTLKKEFTPLFPAFVGAPFLHLLRYQLKQQAYKQGLGRHSRDEVYEIGRRDIVALSIFLGDKKYFLGNEWSDLDATAYAFLITILKQPIESELKNCVRTHTNLVAYCQREEYCHFPEYTS